VASSGVVAHSFQISTRSSTDQQQKASKIIVQRSKITESLRCNHRSNQEKKRKSDLGAGVQLKDAQSLVTKWLSMLKDPRMADGLNPNKPQMINSCGKNS
jgi:hypothetical protein